MSSVQTRKLYGIAGALAILAIPYFILRWDEQQQIEHAQSLCPFKMATGFPCPGCGITKSLIFLYKGDLAKSLYYHVFGPLTVLACILAIAVLTTEIATKKEYFNNILFNKRLAYLLAATLAAYHFGRIVWFVWTHSLDDILQESVWR
ncbi:MAG: DUF2752 domain-containing protein [Saprospiraceae bacterium]